MGIKVRCPSGHPFNAEEGSRGRFARCPKCARVVLVPQAAAGANASVGTADNPTREKRFGLAERFKTNRQPDPAPAAKIVSRPLRPDVPESPSSEPATLKRKLARLADKLAPAPQQLPSVEQPPAVEAPTAKPRAASPPPLPKVAISQVLDLPPAPGPAQPVDRPAAQHRRPTRWVGYRADKTWRGKVYLLTVQLILLALLQIVPTVPVFDLTAAPAWARIVVLLAALQIAYACWMWLVPDWSTVWVAMLVLASVAALYGTALGITWVTPPGSPPMLGLPPARTTAQLWCATIIAVTLGLTYACGRVSYRWHKEYGEE